MTKWSSSWQPHVSSRHSSDYLRILALLVLLITFVHTAPHRTHHHHHNQHSEAGSSEEHHQQQPDEGRLFIKDQMEKYGYLRSHSSPREFRHALRLFQEVLEVEQTGIVDEPTLEAAKRPRCVHPDVKNYGGRRKRFTLSKQAKWAESHFKGDGHLVLKWFVSAYSNDMDRVETRKVVKKAFELWSSQSYIKSEKKVTLTFVEAASEKDADISIMWAEGDHGDDYSFDGANGKKIDSHKKENVLAHTFYPGYAQPLNGDIHFDDAEKWVTEVGGDESERTRFFPYVLAHEIGHTLGLSHSRKTDALMYPYYKKVPLDEITLDVDDKCGVIWNLGGTSNFCLYVWLMSEIVDAHNGSMHKDNNAVGPMSSKNVKAGLKNTKIPKCFANQQNIRNTAEEILQRNLHVSDAQAKKYTDIVCNFLAGLHMWRARPSYHSNESTEKEYRGVIEEINSFNGGSKNTMKRMLRHAEALKKKKMPTVFDPEYFDDAFFENFFMEYLN